MGMDLCRQVLARTVAPYMPRDRVVTFETTYTFRPTSSPPVQHTPTYRPSSPTNQPIREPPSIRRPVTPYPRGLDLSIARATRTDTQPSTSRGVGIVNDARTDPQPSTSRGVGYTEPSANVMQPLQDEDRGVLVDELEVSAQPTPASRAYQAIPSDSEENDMAAPDFPGLLLEPYHHQDQIQQNTSNRFVIIG
ncbi:hypothetical protein HA402_001865 [Bradysia odoriphaga]|nr:hypothetical protein HA402_001865 [Bradysia odoriphaga]